VVPGTQDGVMSEIVNFRRTKKQHAREADAVLAKQNRIRHGRTKAEKANHERAEMRRLKLLDAIKRGSA
jgi:hypothetical protein